MKYFFAFIVFLLFLSSCSSIVVFGPNDSEDSSSRSSHAVSLEGARKLVLGIMGTAPTKGTADRWIVEEYLVNSDSLARGGEEIAPGDSIPPFYVFNFNDNKGYALIAADDRMSPVLCLVDSGSFYLNESLTNPGQVAMLSRIETDYKMAIGMPIVDFNGKLINAEEYGQPKGTSLKLTREEGGAGHWEIGETTKYGYYGTLFQTKWGQREFFNDLMYNNSGEKCPAGCVNIASAQLLNYHGKSFSLGGMYFDWSEIQTVIDTSTNQGTAYGRYLLQNYLYKAAIALNAEMHTDRTSISSSLLPSYFTSVCGYASGGSESTYNLPNLFDEIQYNRYPALGGGRSKMIIHRVMGNIVDIEYTGGHEWVYDGFLVLRTEYIWIDDNNASNNYVMYGYSYLPHCNFGWYGESDGYYYSGDYDTNIPPPYTPPYPIKRKKANTLTSKMPGRETSDTTGTKWYYRYDLYMITGIRPY